LPFFNKCLYNIFTIIMFWVLNISHLNNARNSVQKWVLNSNFRYIMFDRRRLANTIKRKVSTITRLLRKKVTRKMCQVPTSWAKNVPYSHTSRVINIFLLKKKMKDWFKYSNRLKYCLKHYCLTKLLNVIYYDKFNLHLKKYSLWFKIYYNLIYIAINLM